MLEGEDTCSSLLNNGPVKGTFWVRTVIGSFQLYCQPFHNHSIYIKVRIPCVYVCLRMHACVGT